MNYTLYHSKRCSGHLCVDVSDMFIIRSPSLAFSPSGIRVGVLEITGKDSTSNDIKFICSKCSQTLSIQEIKEKSVCECSVCQTKHPVSEMWSANDAMFLCETCKRYLTGEATENVSAQVRKVAEYIFYSSGPKSDRKFTPMSEVLSKPVKF